MHNEPEYTLFHNPRCSKSRAVKEMLDARGIEYALLHYLEDPLTAADLRSVLAKLRLDDPRGMVRTKEAAYAEVGGDTLDADALLDAMVAHRVLIERPILVRGDQAIIGRPPENAERFLTA